MACVWPSPKKQHWEPHDVPSGLGTRAVTASSMSIIISLAHAPPEIMGMPQCAAKTKGNEHLSFL